ncbi:hypothetical protein ACFZB5_13375 [Streptomyces nodosus]
MRATDRPRLGVGEEEASALAGGGRPLPQYKDLFREPDWPPADDDSED